MLAFPLQIGRPVRLGFYEPPRKFSLGAVPDTTDDERKILDAFQDAWASAATLQVQARAEQDFLSKAAAHATALERDLDQALAMKPLPIGFLVELANDNVRTGRAYLMSYSLSDAGVWLPTAGKTFPASPTQGLKWVEPANALIARYDAIRKRAKEALDKDMRDFLARPWEETPRVAPQQAIPRPGEEQLPSGETGRRPRTFLDDWWDAAKKYWWIPVAGIAAYVGYKALFSGTAALLACTRADGLVDLYDAKTLDVIEKGIPQSEVPESAKEACPVKS